MPFIDRLRQGVDVGKFKADQLVRINRVQGEIGDLRRQIAETREKILSTALELHKRSALANPELEILCAAIDQWEAQIVEKEEQIARIRAEPPPTAPQAALRNLGPYEVAEEIGRGGMGIVYKAREPALGRFVALKVLPSRWADQADALARFKREAGVAAKLVHPHVITIYSIGEQEGFHYIAMEYIAGPSLKQVLEQQGRLPLAQAVRLIEQVADALDYAHARGYVHRDIKPANILLRRDDFAILTDFGIVKALYDTGLTHAGMTIGTAEYMAPEQAEGKQVDGRSDIYALGAVAFHMLTGQVPFEGETPTAVLMKHVMEPPPSLRQLNVALSPEIERAVLRALAKKPEQRYAQAGEFARALAQAVGPTMAPPPKGDAAATEAFVPVPPPKPPAPSQ